MDYVELYNELGERLLSTIDKMETLERGLMKVTTKDISRQGGSTGKAAKYEIRLNILVAESKAITEAIKAIKPMADLEKKLREAENEKKKAEALVKELEKQRG